MLSNFFCRTKQLLRRRLLWPLLLLAGIFIYPAQVAWQTNSAANEAAAAAAQAALDKPGGTTKADVLAAAQHAAAIERAQVVSPTYLFSKMSAAAGVFVLIMFLAWGALQIAMPVLPGWAVGDYKRPEHILAAGLDWPVRGFKGTFLQEISPLARICLFLAAFALLVLAAGLAVWAAFTIQ